MRIEELIIDPEDPFKNCQLNRIVQADALLKLIPAFDKGGVIALNNKWGTGKTTFIKMFDKHLTNHSFTTIYFNAWENDFEDNPLAALIAEMKDNFKNEKLINKVIEYGSRLIFDVSSQFFSHQINKHLGEGTVKTAINTLNNSTADIFKEELEEYSKKKKSLTDFKKALIEFVSDNTKNPPLIIFIDELDRCRPNYAVRVLECIKHLFSVPNILFILSIDKKQLEHSINGFYGNNEFDSEEYLRRFIDLEYTLPQVKTEDFIQFQLNSHGLIKYYFDNINKDIYFLESAFHRLFNNLTLRKIEKIIMHFSIILKSRSFHKEDTNLILFLLYLKYNQESTYLKLKLKHYSIHELKLKFDEIYKSDFKNFGDNKYHSFAMIEADFLYSYFHSMKNNLYKEKDLYEEKENIFTVNYDSIIDNNDFIARLKFSSKQNSDKLNLNELLNTIEMLN